MVRWFEQVPFIAVEIFEDDDGAVGFLVRERKEFEIGREHETVIAPEVVSVKKKKHASAGLIADAR